MTVPVSLPGAQRALERRLRAEARAELGRLLSERDAGEASLSDLEHVQALIQNRLVAYQREAGATGKPRILDPAGMAQSIERYLVGEGPLARLLAHPRITDIWVNRPNRILYRLDGEVYLADEVFESDDEVQQLTKRLIAPLGLRLDTSSPFLDARFPGGARLHAAIPPATTRFTVLSLRKYTVDARTVAQLVWPEDLPRPVVPADDHPGRPLVPREVGPWNPLERPRPPRAGRPGMLPADLGDFLTACVRAGIPLVISGAPAAGKTTLLRAVAGAIPPWARVLTLEDTLELDLEDYLPNCVALRTRDKNVENKGEINLRELVRQALRMAPDYVIVGEVRGPESWDLLNALQSGYRSLFSVHGYSGENALARLATRALEAGSFMNYDALLGAIADNVNIVVQVRRESGPGAEGTARHRVVQVYEVVGLTNDRTRLQGHDLWALDPRTDQLVWTGMVPRCLDRIHAEGVPYAPPPVRPQTPE